MREIVKIVNSLQAERYMKNGLNPIKVYWNVDKIVYEFDKEASKPLFDAWRKFELK